MSAPSFRFAVCAVLLALCATPALADTLRVPKNFSTIQQAVDAAQPGDEILISAGKYVEAVDIVGHDELSLRGLGAVKISPPEEDDSFVIFAGFSDGLRLENLQLRDGQQGLFVENVSDLALLDLQIRDTLDTALAIEESAGVLISGLRIDGAATGVAFHEVSQLLLERTRLQGITEIGIDVVASRVVAVENCTVRGDDAIGGVRVPNDCDDLLLRDNRIDGFGIGMAVNAASATVLGNHVRDANVGIVMGADNQSRPSLVIDNRVSHVEGGAVLLTSRRTIVSGNRIAKAGGAFFTNPGSHQNLFYDNRVSGTDIAFQLSSDDNMLLDNVTKSADITLTGDNTMVLGDGPENFGDTLRVPKDFATIQAALNAAETGDLVLIKSGTYDEMLNIEGAEGITVRGKGKVVVRGGGGTAFVVMKCERMRLENLRFEDSDAGLEIVQGVGVEVVRCRFRGNATRDLRIDVSLGVLTDRCRFDESEKALRVDATVASVHRGHRLKGSFEDDSVGLQISDSVVSLVESNRIADFQEGAVFSGVQVFASGNRFSGTLSNMHSSMMGGLLSRNRISGGLSGVTTSNSDGGDTQVLDNIVSNTEGRGLHARASFTIMSGNTVKGAGQAGAYLESTGTLFHANRLQSSGTNGIEAHDSADGAFLLNTSRKNKGVDLQIENVDENVFIDNKLKSIKVTGS
ncbi:MAG: hypothetical protein DHS20C15_27090 [Planctomycetota bacterium]|nr:MAG: hypothetical protein DHS20C15_27090 [Planctomycetota bacterium]